MLKVRLPAPLSGSAWRKKAMTVAVAATAVDVRRTRLNVSKQVFVTDEIWRPLQPHASEYSNARCAIVAQRSAHRNLA